MIFNRLDILRFLTRGNDAAIPDASRPWRQAARDYPVLPVHLIQLGGILTIRAERIEGGTVAPDPIDPVRAAYDEGKRAMAIQLLALMGVTPTELNQLMETNDDLP